MRRNKIKILSVLAVCLTACLLTGTARAEKIDLAGMWRFQLDPDTRFGTIPEPPDRNHRPARFDR